MTPTDIDTTANSILTATGAARVQIIIVMPDGNTANHVARRKPPEKLHETR